MHILNQKQLQATSGKRVMESSNHFKNCVSPKNDKSRGKFLISAMLMCFCFITMAFFSSCSEDENHSGNGNNNGIQNIALSGVIKNIDGQRLSSVMVTTGNLAAMTDDNGKFSFTKAQIVNNRAVLKFEKAGYFTVTRSGVKTNEMNLEVVMQAKGNSSNTLTTSFTANSDKTLSVSGMNVIIPASSLVAVDGSTYTGTVNADVFYLDPNNENLAGLMPGGDLAGIRSDNSEVQLISYGMTDVTLTDNFGNPLQLKDGATSELTFPIPAGMESNPPVTIPLWYFDEAKGIWVEEGEAILQGKMYVGAVNHFSWWNCDYPAEIVTVKGKVTDCNGEPVKCVPVTAKCVGENNDRKIITNSKGEYSRFVPANTEITISVKSSDYGNYSPEVKYNVSGRGGSVVTQDISLPCIEYNWNGESYVTINGIKWATCNVDAPGKFAATPYVLGMFYQWNKKIGWSSEDPLVNSNGLTTWDASYPSDTISWKKANDPSPSGYRVPTFDETMSLLNTSYVSGRWTSYKGMIGYLFTDKVTGARLFLPAAGIRNWNNGSVQWICEKGFYWSSMFSYNFSYGLCFGDDLDSGSGWFYMYSNFGFSIRCVAE